MYRATNNLIYILSKNKTFFLSTDNALTFTNRIICPEASIPECRATRYAEQQMNLYPKVWQKMKSALKQDHLSK